jgi:hypothetical protein
LLQSSRYSQTADQGTLNSFSDTVARPDIKRKDWYADVNGPFDLPLRIYEYQIVFGIVEG